MALQLTLKTKIRVNRQEYASVDDMPPDVRQIYERAVASIGGSKQNGPLQASTTRVVFNGQEYSSVEQMPADVRKLYEQLMATVETEQPGTVGALPSSRPDALPGKGSVPPVLAAPMAGAARPESTTSRLIVAGVLVAALLLASFLLGR